MAQWPRHPNADRHEAARTRKRLAASPLLPSLSTSMEIMMSDSKTLVVIGGSSASACAPRKWPAAQGAQVIIGGRDRQRLDEAPKTLPQNAIARQVDAFSSTSLAAFFEDLPVVDMLFTPGTNYTVTPSPRRPRNRRAARSRASSGRSTGRARGSLPRLAPDASVLLMSGAASARPVKAAPPTPPPMRPSRAWPGWPPSWRRDASTRSRPAP